MIGVVFGTRAEWIKVKPVIDEMLAAEMAFELIFTGQHVDLVTVPEVYKGYLKNIWEIKSSDNRLNKIISSVMENFETINDLENYEGIIVQGDTTSALACAIAAFNSGIKVIHLEAGLRTGNPEHPFPEEANRKMIASLATLHLAPTILARQNLLIENINPSAIKVVGNTVLDNIRGTKITDKANVLITMHRSENLRIMKEWFLEIEELAIENSELKFILPAHPNPVVTKNKNILKSVLVVEPMEHDELIECLSSCRYVITDSGGIQEEASFLRKPTMVCRQTTERSEGLDNFSLLCHRPQDVKEIFGLLPELKMCGESPYGDGRSAVKVVNEIKKI